MQISQGGGDDQRGVPIDQLAHLGQGNGRGHQIAPTFRAEHLVGKGQAGRLSGRNDRLGANRIDVADDGWPPEQITDIDPASQWEVLYFQAFGGASAKIDARHLAGLGIAVHEGADAPDAAHPRLDDTYGERCSDRRIDGVATLFQHPRANLGGDAVLRDDDAAFRARGRFRHAALQREIG